MVLSESLNKKTVFFSFGRALRYPVREWAHRVARRSTGDLSAGSLQPNMNMLKPHIKSHRFTPGLEIYKGLINTGGIYDYKQVYTKTAQFERPFCHRLQVRIQKKRAAPMGKALQKWLSLPALQPAGADRTHHG